MSPSSSPPITPPPRSACALRSVYDQTHPAGEVIVVDDGSIDGTAEIVARSFPGVQLIAQANAGPAAARNTGIAACRGEFVAFLDADDEWLPGKLALQLPLFRDDRVILVAAKEYRQGMEAWRGANRTSRDEDRVADLCFKDLLRNNLVPTSSVVVRRDILAKVGGFDNSLRGAEDFDLWLRIALEHPLTMMQCHLICYHVRPASESRNFDRMTQGELCVLNKWVHRDSCPRERDGYISLSYYTNVMQWWHLKHALRYFADGNYVQGRSYLREALAVRRGTAFIPP